MEEELKAERRKLQREVSQPLNVYSLVKEAKYQVVLVWKLFRLN